MKEVQINCANSNEGGRTPMLMRKLENVGLTQNEILEYLLIHICRMTDAKERAEAIIKKYIRIDLFLNLSVDEIAAELRIPRENAYFLNGFPLLVKNYNIEYENNIISINNYRILIKYLCDNVNDTNYERFFVVYMDSCGNVLHKRLIKSVSSTTIYVAINELVCEARSVCAFMVAISHSHPKGEIIPTIRDGKFTKLLHISLACANIYLIDHVISNSKEYYSYRECGVLEEYDINVWKEYGIKNDFNAIPLKD